jgi:hypothetical protein
MNETMNYTPAAVRAGRPSKFTPATIKRILRCLYRGMPLRLAAQAASISTQGLINHRRANPRFEDAVQKAIARGVEVRLKKIEQASDAGDWRAAAWLLEHCQPQHFARNRLEVTGADGAPLAAGVQLYLPQKEAPLVQVAEPVEEARALTEERMLSPVV